MDQQQKKKRVVIALGGNALGSNLSEQKALVKTSSKAIVDLIESGCEVVVVHGNGPQVGMINNCFNEYRENHQNFQAIPLSVCGAMSQAYIGYDLQNALREECVNRNVKVNGVATIITQTEVDVNDPAFKKPTKPIGHFMNKETAEQCAKDLGWDIVEDSGRGYRRVVPSPLPKKIVEIEAIEGMVKNGTLVVCVGGGGIPVVKDGNGYKGVAAVIDKDYAASLLASDLNADMFIILTAVEKIAINFNTKDEVLLDKMNLKEAEKYIEEKHFAPGSMLPKVKAGMSFAKSKKGGQALITLLEKANEGLAGKTGTIIYNEE